MRANLKGKEATIDDREMMAIIIEDLKDMDLDVYTGLIEYLYPVIATGQDGLITLKPNRDMSAYYLEDIF